MERRLLQRVVLVHTGGLNAVYDDVDALPLLEGNLCVAREYDRLDELYRGKATGGKSAHG